MDVNVMGNSLCEWCYVADSSADNLTFHRVAIPIPKSPVPSPAIWPPSVAAAAPGGSTAPPSYYEMVGFESHGAHYDANHGDEHAAPDALGHSFVYDGLDGWLELSIV
jgi:hypothetical protein